MSAAAFTSSTEGGLIRAIERVEVREGEAVGHARDVVDCGIDRVAAFDQVVEDPPDDDPRTLVFRTCMGTEVDAIEHERAQREHRLSDLLALPDVAVMLRRFDQV